jgi:hypothetical protein
MLLLAGKGLKKKALQRRAKETGGMDSGLAPVGAPNALDKGGGAAGRTDKQGSVNIVDAQFQGAAGKADCSLSLRKLLLDSAPPFAF